MSGSGPGAWRAASRSAVTAPGVVLFLALFASQGGILVLTPILVEVARDFDVSTGTAGQLRSVTGLVAGVTALGFGRVARGVSLRDLLLAGTGLLALGSLLSAAAPSFAIFAAAQVPIGIAVAVLVSAGVAAAAEWARPGRGSSLLSWTLLGPASAWIVGMPLVGVAAERSWRLAFLALPLAASVVVALALSLCPKGKLPATRPRVRLGELLRDRVVGGWAAAELLTASAWAGTLVYVGALFVESYAASPTTAGLVLAAGALAYLPGNVAAARYLRGRRATGLLTALSLLAAGGVAVLGNVRPSLAVSAAVFALLGFLMGGRTLAGGTLGLRAAPDRALAAMGVRAAALHLGYLVGAAAGGVALAAAGYAGLGILFGALFAVAGAVYLSLAAAGTERRAA